MLDLMAVFVFLAYTDTCMHNWLKSEMKKKSGATAWQVVQSLLFSFFCVVALWVSPVLTAILLALVYLLHYANLMHVRYFNQLLSYAQLKQFLTSISTVKNNRTVLGTAVTKLRKRTDIGVPVLWLLDVAYACLLKRPHAASHTMLEALLGCGLLLIVVISLKMAKVRSLHLSHARLFERYGLFVSYLAQIGGVERKPVADTSELHDMKTEVALENKRTRKHPLFGKYKGKNVIYLQLESFQGFLVNSKVKGAEITPFLNRLVRKSMYFDQIFAQYALGHTSDAELVSLNSLYPMRDQVVNFNHFDKSYNALPCLLQEQGYVSAALHGFTGDYYNRNVMMKTYGFDHFFSEGDFHVTEKIGMGFPDLPFFEQSVEKLAKLPQPFFAHLISLTSHFPFDMWNRELQDDPALAPILNDYFQSVHYTDRALERFFRQMERAGLLENTVVVIFGDHEAIPQHQIPDLLQYLELDSDQEAYQQFNLAKIPLLIYAGDPEEQVPQTISTTGSTLDILPTVLSLLGMERSDYQFGQNLFVKQTDFTILRTYWEGSFVSEDFLYVADDSGEFLQGALFDRKTGRRCPFDENLDIYSLYEKARRWPALSDQLIRENLIPKPERQTIRAQKHFEFQLHPVLKEHLFLMEKDSILLPYTYEFELLQEDSRTYSGDRHWQRRFWDRFHQEYGIQLSYLDQINLDANEKTVYFKDSVFLPFFTSSNHEIHILRGETIFDLFDAVEPNSLICIAVKDDGSNKLHPMLESRLADLGIHKLRQGCFRWSYLNVVWKHAGGYRSIYERAVDESIEWSAKAGDVIGNLTLPIDLHLKSAGAMHGNTAMIQMDGRDHALNQRGLNIVVYNFEQKKVVQSTCIDTYLTLYSENTVYVAKKTSSQE